MDDTSTISPDPIIEIPVDDTSLFLLTKRNREFLSGKTNVPLLRRPVSAVTVIGIMTILFGGCCCYFQPLREFVPFLSLIPGLGRGTTITLFALLGFGIGTLLVWYDRQGKHVWWRDPGVGASSTKWKILDGQVVQAEQIRQGHWYGTVEKVAVRYRFAAPDGVLVEGQSEGLLKDTNHTMAPIPGTCIYVWYNLNGWFHLL